MMTMMMMVRMMNNALNLASIVSCHKKINFIARVREL